MLEPRRARPGEDSSRAYLEPDEADGLVGPTMVSFLRQLREGYMHVALATLSVRDRNLLRQYLVDRLTIDQLGRLYRVHRVTASRWVNRAREAFVAATLLALRRRLRVTRSELDSVLRLLRSQVDVSLRHLLQTTTNR